MSVTWIEDALSSLGGVQWLGEYSGQIGLFSEKTTAECNANLYNQDACYTICASIGIGGWQGLLIWPCVNQCMVEACGSGILLSHTQMQKVGVKISPCFNACMDAYQQEAVGTDEAALKAAAQKCANQCGIGPLTKSTPGATKINKPAGGGAPTPSTPSAPPAPAVSRGAGSGGLLVAALVVAGVAALAIGAAR